MTSNLQLPVHSHWTNAGSVGCWQGRQSQGRYRDSGLPRQAIACCCRPTGPPELCRADG